MATTQQKPKFWTYRDTAIALGMKPGPGGVVIAEMVKVHGITPVELGPRARGLDLADVAVIAKALGKTTEAFV